MSSPMATKRKKPPSFPHVHPSRGIFGFALLASTNAHASFFIARKFKKAWVEKAKITSKWKAQKKKEGLMEKAKLEIPQYGSEERDDTDNPSTSSRGPAREELPPQGTKTTRQSEEPNSGKHEFGDVRELMREAYSKSTLHTFKSDPLKKRTASAGRKGEIGKGQPNMKLRMNALLAKIKRDHA